MTADPIPVAVVGAGNMGANHVRVYDDLPETELVEVVEPDEELASAIRDSYDVTVYDDISEISTAAAASIVVPNHLHESVAVEAMENGMDVLIEKPLALTMEGCRAIATAASKHDAIVQVGHIERFNPAVETLKEIIRDEDVISIEAHRLGPFNEHLTDVSVVFDLMIHDLDVIVDLVGDVPPRISAVGTTARSDELDYVVATLDFDSDIVATATASHVTHGKVRKLSVTTQNSYITLDYQEQNLTIQRRGTDEMKSIYGSSGFRTETITETPFIRNREPLKQELEHFANCVRTRNQPRVGIEDGERAMELASAVVSNVGDDRLQ
ncbi:Gfo/Idh/MocA family oxidoreductase [Haloarchaeobius baliensis]|uniref:Gfo/Idh/MocA family oxidoreductase n=1 Tax=Haloarchaeobius baliensis TaxID=1670458 RepID=UPI003F8822A5